MLGTNILNSRAGRAGEVLNPFRGLSLRHSFPISPFATDGMEEEEDQVDSGKDYFSFLSFPFQILFFPVNLFVCPFSLNIFSISLTECVFYF